MASKIVMSTSKYSSEKVFDIYGVSDIGTPINNTAVFVTKKVEKEIVNLTKNKDCLIFYEDGIVVPKYLNDNNLFVCCANPRLEYAKLAIEIENIVTEMNRNRHYTLTNDGYYIGENVSIGKNVVIEKGAFIGHDVIIGEETYIKVNSVIKNARIGNNCVICENSTIGTNGFNMVKDHNGNLIRIPSLGNVIVGNNVEIGALSNISRGNAGNTILCDFVKIDSLVHVGHDAYICENVELTAGTIIGGFAKIGKNTFMGINSSLRNRRCVGHDNLIGMNAAVTNNFGDGETLIGVPAKPRKIE